MPVFYRLVWTDAPNPLGDWDYRGYDWAGVLVVTGRISIVTVTNDEPDKLHVGGTWDFGYAGPPTNDLSYLGPQLGSNSFTGFVVISQGRLLVGFSPGLEEAIRISGTLSGNTYIGQWNWIMPGPSAGGTFGAVRSP